MAAAAAAEAALRAAPAVSMAEAATVELS